MRPTEGGFGPFASIISDRQVECGAQRNSKFNLPNEMLPFLLLLDQAKEVRNGCPG